MDNFEQSMKILASNDPYEVHVEWLTAIRKKIWQRFIFEDQALPSNDALLLHLKRSTWVLQLWDQATSQTVQLALMSRYGWVNKDGVLDILWDLEENMKTVKTFVESLTKGCGCKSGCSKKISKCFKNSDKCGAGCKCINCQNTDDPNVKGNGSRLGFVPSTEMYTNWSLAKMIHG